MNAIEISYMTAAALAIFAMVPQIKKLLETKLSDELSVTTWVIWTGYQLAALAYAVSMGMVAFMIVSIISLPLYLAVLILIIKYRNNTPVLVAQEVEVDRLDYEPAPGSTPDK